jgi:hypothetical protein
LKILEENLIADYADDSDLIGHKKAQKTRRKIRRRIGNIEKTKGNSRKILIL